MLTISKPLSAGQAQNYHQKEFTAKEQNYWSQRGVIAGEWQGRLAPQFGLAGAVSADDFAKLAQGQHPATAEQLVRQRASYEYQDGNGKTIKTMEHRAGWDATFSAPKSVSLTALVGGDERVREAHRESVRVALDQLERYTQARIGGDHPPETTGKFIAAKFEHDTARPVDGYVAPQLHTHAVVFNVTERENGQPRAVQPQSLFASQQFATAIYQSELTYRLRQLGYEITTGRSGAPEIKGYTQEYLDASSPRSQQIREYLERTGRAGKEAAEIAAHSTRDRKEIHSPGEVMAAHRKLAADFGHQAEAVVRQARERQQRQERPVNTIEKVRESLTFARDKNFEREAVVDERALIRDGLRRGMGEVTYAQVRGNLNARLAAGEFQTVERTNVPGRQFTTAKTIEAEQEIVRRMREGRSQIDPVLERPQAIAVADQHPRLNRAQQSVVEDVLSSRDRIQGIQGFAGAGKTTTLAVIRSAAETQGYQVEGFAPTSRAARQLGEAGVEASTLQGFLARTAEPTATGQKYFYFVDESSLASTNQLREFLARLGPNDRVLLIGDIRQHQGVEAGRPFEQLQEAGMRTAKLDEIVRQKDPALKSTVELLANGHVSCALDTLQKQGRVQEIPNKEERIRAIAKSYVESPQSTLIVSPDNASRRELNLAVRQESKANGTLAPEDHSFRVLVQRQDMTGAERSWASHYEVNDVVRYARGSKSIGIEAGSYGSVVAIDPTANLLTIQKQDGELATYDPRRLTGVSVYSRSASDIDSTVSKGLSTLPTSSLRGVADGYGNMPLSFESNKGQTDPSVQFTSRGDGYALFLKRDEAVLALYKAGTYQRTSTKSRRLRRNWRRSASAREAELIHITMSGANPHASVAPMEALPGKSNYLVGNDPKKWITGAPTYKRVKYSGIYPGVDLVYYGNRQHLEFDYVVAPKADPGVIRLHIDTRGSLNISEDGSLKVEAPGGRFTLDRPEIYQMVGGEKRLVDGGFVKRSSTEVGIRVGTYDRTLPLIVDPVLTYSTYLGGSGDDELDGIATDSDGNAYLMGTAHSLHFPTLNGYTSTANTSGIVFVTKLDPTGTSLLYSTYLGGTGGEYGWSMAGGQGGIVYLVGETDSSDFPVAGGFQPSHAGSMRNGFVARIDTTQAGVNSLGYSTYLGGGGNSANPMGDVAMGVAVDSAGLIYVTGQTTSDTSTAAFPTTANAYQSSLASTSGNAFLTVLDPSQSGSNSLVYSTYLGGSSTGWGDYGAGVAVDASGNAYITGMTTSGGSAPFPTTSGGYQTSLANANGNAFVAEIATRQSGTGSLVYSTYLGGSTGSYGDDAAAIVLDASGKVYVTGDAGSSDFPATSGAYQTSNSTGGRAYVAKIDPAQTGSGSLIYATYLGGSNGPDGEAANGLAVDSQGSAYVVGNTSSTDFPTTLDAIQSSQKSNAWNGFFAQLNSSGTALLYSTYWGGSCGATNQTNGDFVAAVALDSAANVYLGGSTCSSDYAATANAYQTNLTGTYNAFVAKLAITSLPPTPLPPDVTSISPTSGSVGTSVTITGTGFGTAQGTSTVSFNGTVAAPTSWSNTSIVVPAPSGATTGNLVVTVNGLTSSGVTFTVLVPPAISAISPNSGPIGTAVTVTGTNFGATQGASSVSFNGTAATPTSWSDTQIIVTVPTGATTGNVVVSVNGVAASASYTVTQASPSITATGSLNVARSMQTSTLLSNGKELIVGGYDSTYNVVSSAELYDPTSATFSLTGSLATARQSHTATLLPNGQVLISGGVDNYSSPIGVAELFDPSSGTFSLGATLNTARSAHTATMLHDGRVLIVGGQSDRWTVLSSAEIYDPATGSFTSTGNLNSAREYHTATLLNNGQVLISGGLDNSFTPVPVSELFDLGTGSFSYTGTMNVARQQHTATLLDNGQVLLVGGIDTNYNNLTAAELYDPASGTFSSTASLNTERVNHTATLLSDGTVLFAEGQTNSGVTGSTELYDPVAGTFSYSSFLSTARQYHTATMLGSGVVLITGGIDANYHVLAQSELYQPASLIPPGLVSIELTPTGSVISAGSTVRLSAIGTFSDSTTKVLASAVWSSPDTTIATVTSDAGDHGYVYGVGAGTVTLAACEGTICGQTAITVGSSVQALPTITSLSATTGPVGTPVTITGANFSAVQGQVTFNGVAATVSSWSNSQISAVVPQGASTGSVLVIVAGAPSNEAEFTVTSSPSITSLSPASGRAGTSVAINGHGFGPSQESGTVTFNGVAATPTSWTDTQILTLVPSAATTGNVVVSTASTASNGMNFTVPTVVSIAISLANPSVYLGTTFQLTALGTLSDGTTQDVTSIAAWSSSTPSVVSVQCYSGGGSASVIAARASNKRAMMHVVADDNWWACTESGTALAVGQTTIQASVGSITGSTTVTVNTPGNIVATGAMNTARSGQTATLLPNGTVLVAGGPDNSAELYDPISGTFTTTASLGVARHSHTATLLSNGTVLLAGGVDTNDIPLASVELYLPGMGTVTPGSMISPRVAHTATLLNNGKILITGGEDNGGNTLSSAELFDPATGTSSQTGSLNFARQRHSATLLNSGLILIAGGDDGDVSNVQASAELYDPSTGIFTVIGNMDAPRSQHTATLLNNGQVLIVGGSDDGYADIFQVELFDPIAGVFSYGGWLQTARLNPPATLLNNGLVLVAGGWNGSALNSADLFDPVAENTVASLTMNAARSSYTATLLNNGSVLLAGGVDGNSNDLSSADLFTPGTLVLNGLSAITVSPVASPLSVGGTQSFVANGTFSDGSTQTLASVAWNSSNNTIATLTNDSSNHGGSFGVAVGSATVSACAGAVCGSTSITVSTPGTQAPSISSLSPTAGAAGSSVTITGANFGTPQSNSAVTFNGIAANPTNWSSTSIVATVPNGSTTGNVIVTASGVPSNGMFFTGAPNIGSLSPASGSVGTVVTIAGANFGNSQGTSAVTFNGTPAVPVSWNSTSIVVPVPAGATTGNLIVTVSNSASNGANFIVGSLSSLAVTPQALATGIGVNSQFAATGTYSDGSTLDLSATATWTSSAPTVATIGSSGLAVSVVTGSTTITVAVGNVTGSSTLTVVPNTAASASINTGRLLNTATLLDNGTVLLVGGQDSNYNTLGTAEVCNPGSGSCTFTGSLNTLREQHTSTLLNNGQVLIAGGFTQGYIPVAAAELYDPVAGVFTNSSSLVTARYAHTASLLNNGQVLLTGGIDGWGNTSASAELFNLASSTFTATGNLQTARNSHTATLLNNGQVLLVGGADAHGNILSSAELYDPASGAFAFTGALNTARQEHTATLLNSGLVLITGGVDNNGAAVASAELYDPSTGTFTNTGSLNVGREQHTATLLTNGKVLVAGGLDTTSTATPSIELYDPIARTFTYTSILNVARSQQTATLLNSGSVFLGGGVDQNSNALTATELYQPDSLVPSGLVSITVNPLNPSLPTGTAQALTATGTFTDNSIQTLASVIWASSDSTIATLTNDASNHGHAFGVASGNATVNACTGSICGSTSISIGTATSAPPSILSLSPSSGGIGTTVTISGAGFGPAQGSSTVTFNGVIATQSVWSDTQIVVSVPVGATSGNVVVTVQGVASNDVVFTLLASASGAPSISSLSPISGMVGTIIEITGTGFGSSTEAGTVTFNGVPALLAGWTNTQISVMVPSGASTGNVMVTVPSGTSNGINFTVISLTSIAVSSQTLSLHVDNTAQFSVTGTYSDGSTLDLTSQAAWSSSAPQVATINNSGLATAVGTGQSTIQATIGSLTGTTAVTVTSNFTLLSGAMSYARAGHTATVLNDGTVLYAGGIGLNLQAVPTAELYNAGAGTFTSTGSLNFPRQTHTATLLNNGTVLVAGGQDAGGNIVTSEELYDPVAGVFNVAPAINTPRYAHTATLLSNGQVLVVGGIDSNGNVLAGAEIYDPTAGVFTTAGSLNSARQSHTATLLDNGMVLITGGSATTGSYSSGGVLASAELYDPATGTFTFTGALTNARSGHTATLLNDGTVLLSGGGANDEVYSFVSGNFSVVDTASFVNPTSTLLNNGQVLILQGSQASLYDPRAGSLTAAGSMNSNRVGATATLLNSGAVLVMGGYWEGLLNQPLSSAELYPPSSLVPASLVSISVNPLNPTLPAGTAQSLIAVGTFSDNSTQDIVSATWGSSDTTIAAVTNDSSNRGSVFGVSPGLTTVNACTGTVCGSTTITVGPSGINPPPTILSASAIGSLLTISGNGFGTSSSAGIVTINGTVAIPNSYSNTQIVVPIPVQMTTGAVMVTVAGIPSNVAFFNVLPGSTTSSPIIASLSPVSGAIGTSVTITGTNLGSAEVSAVMFNGAGAVPSSWSETKIVVIVPNAATTGNVVVTVGGTPSAGVNFTVLQPTSMNITPANPTGNEGGSVQFHATAVYASGSMQDVTSAVSWSSSQTGVATIAGNGLAALLGVGQANIQAIFGNLSATANLTVNWSGSSSAPYQVFPSSLKMITGDTRTLSVADGSGNPVTGLRWSSTNSDVVKLSTANPPLITGVAPGSATVYAGIVPVPVTVYSAGTVLPPGTPIWSLPLPGGSSGGTVSIIPAIPYSSSTDPTNDPAKEASRIRIANDDTSAISSTQSLIADIYVLNGSTLQAITSDKNVAWTVFGLPDGTTVTAGFLGDALLLEPLNSDGNMRLQRADSGGNLSTVYTSPSTNSISFVPHPSGVIYIQDGNTISVVSASTQSLIASVTLFQDGVAGSIISSLIVAGDGNAYIEYETFEGTGSWADYYYCPMAGTSGLVNTVGHVFLLEIRPDGTTANIHLEDYTNEWGCKLYAPSGAEWTAIPPFDMPSPDPSKTYAYGAERWDSGTFVANGSIITNADDGVVVSIPRQDVICEDTIEYTAWTATMLIPPPYTYYEWTAQEYGYSNDQCNGRSGVKLTTDMVLVSNGSVVSTTNIDLYGFMPTLQRSDGSYIGTGMDQNFDNTLAAVDFVASTSGQTVTYPVWQQKDVIGTPLYALSDGGVVVTTSANGTLGTLFTLDAAGNIASQMPDAGAVTSWTGSLYVKASTGSVSSIVASPPATAEDSYWAFRGGNPSGNDVALPQCPCLLQSAGSVVSHDEVSAREASLGETSREAFHNEAATQSGGRCQVADGSKSTFLLIIGDPGNGEHNIGNGWNLAARQKENDLVAEGHRVVSCRASSVQDVNQALTQNGLIDGGVIYFGHSGPYIFTDPGTKAEATLSILAVGQGRGLDTNLAYYNVNELCDPAQGCNVNKILGANAAMLINGCRAGVPVGGMRGDASGTSRYPIARLLKSQLQRGVYAYMVGMYLSQLDAAHDPQYGPKQGDKVPNSLPMYMVPLGAPFHKPSPTAF